MARRKGIARTSSRDKQLYLFICGNPVDGCRYVGPFDTHEDAEQYGEDEGDGDWWIAELDAPAESFKPRAG